MKLNKILETIKIEQTIGSIEIDINNINLDSRKVTNNDLFVATSGTNTDGHNFIDTAIKNGATAILCQQMPTNIQENITYIKTQDSTLALSKTACNFYDNPSEKIKLIGITGTNGKTTTVTLLFHLFQGLGYKVGLISTIKNMIDRTELKATHTTPNALEINKLLDEMVYQGCEYCFMEVSSHAIVQNRITGLNFTGAIFSNITHDHLDYHGTFAEYIKAKKRFFDNLPKTAFALINNDDRNAEIMVQNCKATIYRYSLQTVSDFKARILESCFEGMLLEINNTEMWTHLIGQFNAYNILAVYSTAILLKQNKIEILTTLSNIKPVEGRFNAININNITAIVDYAHTPDAVENVIKTIEEIKEETQNTITVIGAGGDRDKTKRPIMAKIAANYSQILILTSDNPRTENPEQIIDEMYQGAKNTEFIRIFKITDRKEAIYKACDIANKGDIILIAGKGHENYQEINGTRTHFDDTEIVTKYLEGLEIKNYKLKFKNYKNVLLFFQLFAGT